MSLEEIILKQPPALAKYGQAKRVYELCYRYMDSDGKAFAISLAISYGVMLGKRLARSGREVF